MSAHGPVDRAERSARQALAVWDGLRRKSSPPENDPAWPALKDRFLQAADDWGGLCRLAAARYAAGLEALEDAKHIPGGKDCGRDRILALDTVYTEIRTAWAEWRKAYILLGQVIAAAPFALAAAGQVDAPPDCPP
jgi:hypothetical protein